MSGHHLAAVIAVGLIAAGPCAAQTVAVWQPRTTDLLACEPTDVATLLAGEGYAPELIATETLLDPAALTPDRIPLLVIPTLGAYPDEAVPVLEEYLRAGGHVLSLGGAPFSRPIARGPDGEWQLTTVPETPAGQVRTIADFEDGVPEGLSGRDSEVDELSWERTPADGGQCLRASIDDLQQWAYVEMPLADTGDESFTVLRLRARGDANTPVLGLELNESDGSRWKYVVPLTERWREYRIFIPHFLSYATEGRGGEGDSLHPERLTRLGLGFTAGMVGGGPHTVWLDDIQRWQFEPPSREAVPRDGARIAATAAAYGNLIVAPADNDSPLLRLFASAEYVADVPLQTRGPTTILRADDVTGRWSGWAIDVRTETRTSDSAAMSARRVACAVPVLVEPDTGRMCAGVAHLHGGELAGGTCAFFSVDEPDLLANEQMRHAVSRTVEYLLRWPHLVSFDVRFGVADEQPVRRLTAQIAAPPEGVTGEAILQSANLDGVPQGEVHAETLELAGGEVATVELVQKPDLGTLDPAHYRLGAGVRRWQDPLDQVGQINTVDTRTVMRRLCDYLVEHQADDGTFAGAGYLDERAARGLLAMYEMTGEERYRDAAVRWGDNEVEMQREDGGYRMGYGIRDTGEACYVADGGEIAIGMVRLLKYVDGARRERYMQSLRDYFRYREGFRLEDGRIAVGWVFNSRYTQAGGDELLDAPVRSDTSFGFVCGCTLAAASAWKAVTGDPDDRAMAIRDARWFLEDDLHARSVFAEAAQWAHYFIDDPDIRAGLEERMRETLVPYTAEDNGWWYAAGGRSGVTLGALHYYANEIDPSSEARAGVMRGLYHMVCDASPSRLQKVIDRGPRNQEEWRYLCYSAVSLAEILDHTGTMWGIAQ